MTKIKINNNTTNEELMIIIKNIDSNTYKLIHLRNIDYEKKYLFEYNKKSLVIIKLLKKIIKYNKFDIFLDFIENRNPFIWDAVINSSMKINYDTIYKSCKSEAYIPFEYINKYAYYYKNINIINQFNLLCKYTNLCDYYCEFMEMRNYSLMTISFLKYLKRKKSRIYIKIYTNYINDITFDSFIENEIDLDILNILYKYNGKIRIYAIDDYCAIDCKTINLNNFFSNKQNNHNYNIAKHECYHCYIYIINNMKINKLIK